MKWVVLGTGAMGSLFASQMARSGAQVAGVEVSRAQVDAIRAGGVRVLRETGEQETVPLSITDDPGAPGQADALLVFTKYYDTAAALATAGPLVGPGTLLVTLQNGLGNVELIRAAFPANRILHGFTTLTSEIAQPGCIRTGAASAGETFLWPLDGRADAQAEAVRDALVAAGLRTALAPDIELRIWKKLVINCCLNATCAVTGLTCGEFCSSPEGWRMLEGIADELVAVAAAKGIGLEREVAHGYLRAVAHEAREHYPSMVSDVRAKRPTEIEALNGAVLREAARLGIEVPWNRAAYSLVKAIEGARRG